MYMPKDEECIDREIVSEVICMIHGILNRAMTRQMQRRLIEDLISRHCQSYMIYLRHFSYLKKSGKFGI